MLKFTPDHEWLLIEEETVTVGITDYAQEQLGDLVFVQLPALGAALQGGDAAAVVESVKAASDVYSPIAGEVVAVNDEVVGNPALVNSDPMQKGWLFKLKVADRAQFDKLMNQQGYRSFVDGLSLS
jgi:glycine cleavage system H protein